MAMRAEQGEGSGSVAPPGGSLTDRTRTLMRQEPDPRPPNHPDARWSRRGVLVRLILLLGGFAWLDTRPALGSPDKDGKGQGKGHEKTDASKGKPKNAGESSPPAAPRGGAAGIDAAGARALALELGVPLGGKPLPPGIRKNLARGKPLPPGIAQTRLPPSYLARLPQHPGYTWMALGTDLLLVAIGSQVIGAVLSEVFR